MKLSKVDLTMSLSAHEPEAGQARSSSIEYSYADVRDFPGRVVLSETAYGRLRKNPGMSLEEACLTPRKQKRSSVIPQMYSKKKLLELAPYEYIEKLKTKLSHAHIARVWGISCYTVKRHRVLLAKDNEDD